MSITNIGSVWKNGALSFYSTARNIEVLTLFPHKTGCGNADLIRSMWTPSPEIASIYFEDFINAPVTASQTFTGFTVTQNATTASIALADEVGGALKMYDVKGAVGAMVELQHKNEWVLPATSKDIWFEARVKARDADQNLMFVGLTTTDTSIIQSNPNNAVGFWLKDNSAALWFECSRGTATPVALATSLVDKTYARLSFYIDSNTHVHAYVDDVEVSKASTSWNLNEVPHTEMAPALCWQSGVASTSTYLTIDYVKVIQLR